MKQMKPLLSLALAMVMILALGVPAFAAVEDTGYADVDAGAWYADAVKKLTARELMNGTGGGNFSPEGTFTRAQLATVLYRMAGSPAVTGSDGFSDTPDDAWYAAAVKWAEENSIVNGIGNCQFGPDRTTTQEQLVTMLWRDAGEPASTAASDASGWAAEAVGWARAAKLIQDDANYTFAPTAEAKRAQIALIVARYLNDGNNAAATGQRHTNAFDFEKKTVLLNSGYEMPIIGIGTFTLSDEQAEQSVYWALEAGARLIDTAAAYNNETGVGRGIQRAIEDGIVTREEIFVTTKLWPSNYNAAGIDHALETLGLDYIDLMLLHQPAGDYMGGYTAMEQAVSDGKLRSIGLSNFSDTQFAEVADQATILPAVHQVETHLHNQQTAMRGFLDQYGTVLEAWFPLGGRGNTQIFLNDPTVLSIAEAHNKSAAQIILRWHLQDGHIAIPGSSNQSHIQENVELFDFELTIEEMANLRALNENSAFFPGMGATSEETQEMFEQWAEEWGININ